MNNAPFEVIAQPYVLYVAPVGTEFPAIDEEPGEDWTKIGTSGDLNYTEDGVTVQHGQSIELWRPLGSTGPRKAFRTEEEMHVTLVVADLTLEQYSIALNYNEVETTPPDGDSGGFKQIGLSRGLGVEQRALLVRGRTASAYGNWPAQYQVPIAVEMGEPEVVFTKGGEPAGLELDFVALEDPDADSEQERFGILVMQNADQTS